MEVHLTKISDQIIRLDYDEKATNIKHLNKVCEILIDKMKENDEVFEELFERLTLAGSYPDGLKISEPDEYDMLVVLKFPSPCVAASRPGYVTINISNALQNGWVHGNVDYKRFVDGEGYLIQNKALDWIKGIVRDTLNEEGYKLYDTMTTYSISQSYSGPAVTLHVSVSQFGSEDREFSIDFVICLAFHSDEWWTSDVSNVKGVWNAVPRPIKAADKMMMEDAAKNLSMAEEISEVDDGKTKTQKTPPKKVNRKLRKVDRPPSCFEYNDRKSEVDGKVDGAAINSQKKNKTRSSPWYRKPKRSKIETNVVQAVPIICNKVLPSSEVTPKPRWEKLTANPPGTKPRHWYRKSKKTGIIKDKENKVKREKPTVKESTDDGLRTVKPKKPMIQRTKNPKGSAKVEQKASNVPDGKKDEIVEPNPQKNREWSCSYAEIEREFLKGTNNMKPLIRIFKKIRDHKRLTNLKSFYIKTIFLRQSLKNGAGYWQQSLAVLFMEMCDVLLQHLEAHDLENIWHHGFNWFRRLLPGQVRAVYDTLAKMKTDLETSLENDNPEFIYEVVCTEDERALID